MKSNIRQQQKEQTREKLLKAAYTVFTRQGITQSRMADIATRTHDLSESGGSLEEVLSAFLKGIEEYEGFYTRLLLEARLLPQSARDSFVMIQSVLSLHFTRVPECEETAAKLQIPAHMLFSMWIGLVHHYLQNGDLFAPEGGVITRHGPAILAAYLRLLR